MPWEARSFKIRAMAREPFFMIGGAMNPDPNLSAEFSVMMTGAGPDLRALVPEEPVIVPLSKWTEWLTNGPNDNLWFPTREGTFICELA